MKSSAELGHLQIQSTSFSSALSLLKNDDNKGVKTTSLPNFDAFSLTAIGFGLIAFNFFVLANMEGAGLAGIIARIINTIS